MAKDVLSASVMSFYRRPAIPFLCIHVAILSKVECNTTFKLVWYLNQVLSNLTNKADRAQKAINDYNPISLKEFFLFGGMLAKRPCISVRDANCCRFIAHPLLPLAGLYSSLTG